MLQYGILPLGFFVAWAYTRFGVVGAAALLSHFPWYPWLRVHCPVSGNRVHVIYVPARTTHAHQDVVVLMWDVPGERRF